MSITKSLKFINKDILTREVAVRLGGKTAEELIFGKENITEGAEHDVRVATKLLLQTYRAGCISPNTATYESETRGSGQLLPEDQQSKDWVEEHLNVSYSMALEALESNKEAFRALVDLLLKNRTLDSEGIQTGLSDYGIHYENLLDAYPRTFQYKNKLEVFLAHKGTVLETNGYN